MTSKVIKGHLLSFYALKLSFLRISFLAFSFTLAKLSVNNNIMIVVNFKEVMFDLRVSKNTLFLGFLSCLKTNLLKLLRYANLLNLFELTQPFKLFEKSCNL